MRAAISFRSSTQPGPISELSTATATELKNKMGQILARADSAAIVITRHNRPEYVVLRAAAYEKLVQRLDASLSSLHAEFDAMVAKMNTSRAGEAFDGLFAATPTELGEAAANAANKHG